MKSLRTAAVRAVLYARFSSDMQKDRSIGDQFVVCEKYAARQDFKVVAKFSDRAKSGTSMFDRDGLRDLLAAAKRKEFDIVIVEATDRLSRNAADLPWIAQHLQFNGVKIFTTSNGEVSDMQIAFDGVSNPGYSKKLAERVKRGHDGIAREGLVAGSLSYGYDCVKHQPGIRVINEREAAVVRRIFTEYTTGISPREICAGLARDGILSPSGRAVWNFQIIVGGENKRGIIHNRLYIGEYVKNRYVNVKNPETGKVITRKGEEDDLIVAKVPHLRIVDQDLWDAAHALRKRRSFVKFGESGYVQRAMVPRTLTLLSGLLRCGECNGPMSVTASSRKGQRIGCSAAANRGACVHGKTYDLGQLTDLAVDNMCTHLLDPEFIKEKARARAIEFARIEKQNAGDRQATQQRYDRLNLQIAKLVRALEDGDMPRELLDSLKAKEVERKGLEERLRLLNAESNVTTLHPATLGAFGKSIETLHAKLKRNRNDTECRLAFANIVDSIVVHPTAKGAPYEISVYARLAAIMGIDLFPTPRTNQEIIAAEGLPRVSVQSEVTNRSGLDRNGVFLLGRWRAAA